MVFSRSLNVSLQDSEGAPEDGENRSIIPQTSAPIQLNTDVNQGASKSYDGADMSVSKSSVCADVL